MCAKHTHAELCAHAQAADLCTQGSRTPCQAGWVEQREVGAKAKCGPGTRVGKALPLTLISLWPNLLTPEGSPTPIK